MNSPNDRLTGTEFRMKRMVDILCSEPLLPRDTGSRGAALAAAFLADEMRSAGLEPYGDEEFIQRIPPIGGSNVLGAIPGRSDRWLVLAAHYDACGSENPGADDNASGVAVALEVARRLGKANLEHSVLVALFDAEEPPNFLTPYMGSQWFVDHPTVPIDLVDTMICLDIVGHALGSASLPASIRESIFVLGAETGSGTSELFESLPSVDGIIPRRLDHYLVPPLSDHYAFMNESVPFLFYTCGRTRDYHEPTDTPDRLDDSKMAALADHLLLVVNALGNRASSPAYRDDAADDKSSATSVIELASALRPHASDLNLGLDRFDSAVAYIQDGLAKDAFTAQHRRMLGYLVFAIEEALT